ncbi:MAG: O-antigen ligase family protein [Candidatus Aminicenantes bacterium]|nr:O-antigen ligase family protein [Candidatus Aminicenantes bacterium]
MNILKPILRIGSRFQEIEFSFLLAWALLFPDKQSYLYYFGFTTLLVLFCLKKIFTLKNISVMRVSLFLLLFNTVMVGSAFFSPHPGKSLLFLCDILLLSLWFFFFDIEKIDIDRYLRLLAFVISIASLAIVILLALRAGHSPPGTVFNNPILQGIAAALAVLFFLHALLLKFTFVDLALLLINTGAVIVSASKAASLGLALFSAAMILARNKRWLIYFMALVLLLALVPNPLRHMVGHSLRHDTYVLNRLDIWSMSARMFRAHPWTGIGPDLFDEAAKRFNFPQEKGPARYAKLPESPHSDYWKMIVETGLAGLIFVLLFLFFTIRRLLVPPWFDLPKVLLAFLLLQMLFFNFVFNNFFLLVTLFLLYAFFWRRMFFVSLAPALKVFLAGLLFVLFIQFYLLPLCADRMLRAATGEKDIPRRFALLNRAALFSPLDERMPLARAQTLRGFFKAANSLEAWTAAWEDLRLAQRLNRNSSEACVLEAALFGDIREKKIVYPALAEEMLAPLRRAQELDPFNPFLRLQQAVILNEFDRRAEARRLANAALGLEPDYVAALFFMRRLDGSGESEAAFQKRIAGILAKAKALRVQPGSYLYNLYCLPPAADGSGR